MSNFTGRYTVSVDGKGRIAIPAKLRAIAAQQGSEKFIVRIGFDGCLDLYSEAEYKRVSEQMTSKQPIDARKARFLKRYIHPNSAEGVPDTQGRIAIPRHLLDSARITDKVLILGVGEKIELWNEDQFNTYQQSFDMSAEEVVENLFGLGS
ncbi:MAG: division/cell wall cluster transcriptional repressor MraZ [candidate division Zixibacteria bacterium]|nr:division/cell wall cluster transcriptional repressor MraZ [candidate division Zixibacteria bacterium]